MSGPTRPARPDFRAAAWWTRLMLLGALVAAGCGEQGRPPAPAPSAAAGGCACAPAQPVVDPALLAFLSKAKAVHHQADLAEQDGQAARAIALLDALVAGPRPGGWTPPVEAREVLADTLARLAELRSGLGRFEAAKGDVEAGLKLARERTHYRGRLYEVLGVVEQRWHDKLREQDDTGKAEEAKSRAIAAFQRAIDIQDAVIREALGDGGVGDGGSAP